MGKQYGVQPAGFEDVCNALHDAKAAARDVLKTLSEVDAALGSDAFGDMLVNLQAALAELEYARECTEKCVAPIDAWHLSQSDY
jgi:hypothetical protein